MNTYSNKITNLESDKIYDQVIIGAGFAGLYWIHKFKPNNWICLEKSDRIGGRVYNIDWNGSQISLGGGVLRPEHNLLIELVKEFGLELSESISKYQMVDLEISKKNQIKPNEANFYCPNKIITKYLTQLYLKNKEEIEEKKFTFEEFLEYYLDSKSCKIIKSNLLYKTYLDSDVFSTLKYEFDELMRTEEFKINWIKPKGYTSLLENLIKSIDVSKIKLNSQVDLINLNPNDKIFSIILSDDKILKSRSIVLATESKSKIKFNLGIYIAKLVNSVYSMVSGSNYIRVYSFHNTPHGLTCSYRTNNLPGKVILINKNILMCCYTEGYQATQLINLLRKNNNQAQSEIVYKLLINSGIPIANKPDDIIIKYWDTGVHYNNPGYDWNLMEKNLKELSLNNIFLIGESVNKTHGWVNCALESVEFYKK